MLKRPPHAIKLRLGRSAARLLPAALALRQLITARGGPMKVRVNGVEVHAPETHDGQEKLVIEVPGERVVTNFHHTAENTYIVPRHGWRRSTSPSFR